MQATVQGDVPVVGAQLSCASCHRHSGLGSSEGSSNVAPALTAASLYQPRDKVLRQAYRSKAGTGPGRPAYTEESLALAIRAGVDPGGRVLNRLMPRYAIDDEGMESLIAYLKTLSAGDAPGVTDSTLHIATIVTEGVPDDQRRAMLDVLETFVELKNRGTRNELGNARYATFYRDQAQRAYRKWALHVWHLEGPRDSWGAQLAVHYAEQPVFAVLNGIAAGSWAPIHEFCVSEEIPCLFPHTDQPVTSRQDFYALYLSSGLDLEARALARHLQLSDLPPDARIVQVWERGGAGETAARGLREAFAASGRDAPGERVIAAGEVLSEAQLRSILAEEQPGVLVLWLPEPGLEALALLAAQGGGPDRIFLSSSLGGHDPSVPRAIRQRVNLVHPFDVPGNASRTLSRLNHWLDSRGLAHDHPRIRADAFFAVMFFGRGMTTLSQNFSREYLIEVLEHTLNNATFASVYPRVSLGPDQRFASKGSYILGLSHAESPAEDEPVWLPISDWIIP